MSISLFKHNMDAYNAALCMLKEEGKAAIIHPTGTGKSFIGFKLCEDNPSSTVCWLSPSEYIYKTQLENLASAADGYQPENLVFFTYAKLMNMTEEEIVMINPQYIILDEFHRAGAEFWGEGVQRLLKTYPNVPVLGLSATNIRYLDNQRNMAEELFDGNIASEMTLGEAIVRGILSAPKYVLSVFSYKKSLEKYEYRVRNAKNKIVRDEGEKYLEALRRALDKADGLEEIFARHIEEKDGKYIVFCANYEHLCEMVDKSAEWFSKVDKNPNVYVAYSNDPTTNKAFNDFKKDESDHLKLLFCIDMLNEGVHVDDVSGVILLRPTISPIIYKQQIGRALSASKKKNAVIFDIVLNVENLYSIGAVQDEMQIATAYYRSLGQNDEIVTEQFKVIDEVRDCIELFDRLNDTLSTSWDLMFDEAEKYYEENGNLEVPKRFVTENGFTLGSWLNTQRAVKSGKANGILTNKQIEKLDSIGMRWENAKDLLWEKYFLLAKQYFKDNGNLLVPATDEKTEGLALGKWLSRLRTFRKNNLQCSYLTEERIKALDEIGMVWDVLDHIFEKNYIEAYKYYEKYGNLDVPSYYVTDDGVRLGAWISYIRGSRNNKNAQSRELSDEQIKRLDNLGMIWENKYENAWNKSYEAACEYKKQYGNLDIPVAYVTDDGLRLGKWIRRQRDKKDELASTKKKKLDDIGMIWEFEDPWEKKISLVENYYKEHGHLKMPPNYVVEGVWLARWFAEQLARYKGKPTGRSKTVKTLTSEQILRMEALGV